MMLANEFLILGKIIKTGPIFLNIFVQDYLHVAWQYTYGTKYWTLGGTEVKNVLGKTD